ncbi:hypothetical protein Nepgr_029073 [Nepenthes gracilis]|uniref:Uncharacterized protein n=1 Tax=Nepenthes gracilis TaxID=150966 RepID=A0AAD3TBR2_NEPGR|nr:hypothetical protein Nepgr_029073 [Nepenthes gracilis]
MRNSTANEIHRQHLLILPYPSTSHVIPLLDLTHRLLTGGLTVTLLATPPLIPLLRPLLSLHPPPFLQTLLLSPPDAPQNRLIPKLRALRELYDPILEWIRSQASPPNAIVSNFFLGWANQLAREAGVPHIVFSPCGALGTALFYALWRDLPRNDEPENENFEVCFEKLPNSPTQRWWQLSHVYRSLKEGDADWEFFRESALANLSSWGTVVNSFTELDRVYIDYFKREMGHNRVWAVGPLLPPEDDDTSQTVQKRRNQHYSGGGGVGLARRTTGLLGGLRLLWKPHVADERSDGGVGDCAGV